LKNRILLFKYKSVLNKIPHVNNAIKTE
jgi:hypothetical protein